MRGRILQSDAAASEGRVVDGQAVAVHAGQHDEMVEIPMQHAGELQRGEMFEFDPHRARRKFEFRRHAYQVGERRAHERDRVALAQCGEFDNVSVTAAHHCQAGQAAFGRLRLQYNRRVVGDARAAARQRRAEYAGTLRVDRRLPEKRTVCHSQRL
jgi:hypothetical protein